MGCSVQGEDVDGESIENDVLWYHYHRTPPIDKLCQHHLLSNGPQFGTVPVFHSCMGRVTDNSQSRTEVLGICCVPPMITSMLVNPQQEL